MSLSAEEIIQIAKASAQAVLEGLHRYAVDYKEPETIEQGLRDSMVEEKTAADWYRRRAAHAALVRDSSGHIEPTIPLLYKHIADEEDRHYKELKESLEFVQGHGAGILPGTQGNITWEHIMESTDTYVLWQGKDPDRGDVFAFVAPAFGGLPATGYTTPRAAWNAFRPGQEFAYNARSAAPVP